MRTKNSIKNSAFSTISVLLHIIVGFIVQKLFINILSEEYLGVNGLFSNIITMLSIAELGIGEAIIFHLYKPIAEKNKEAIKSLMNLYKKAYIIIMIAILIIGIALIPFINFFIGETTLDLNFKFVYLLFLFQTIISYVFTYKRSLLYADQKNYVITIIHIICTIVFNILQIWLLFVTKNYYLYLCIKIAYTLIENTIINIYVNKTYPYIKEKNALEVSKEKEKDILNRVGAQFFHKIGGIVVNGTDNILISKFFGLAMAGLYSNYYLVISSVRAVFAQLISPITASVGNLLIENDQEKTFQVYNKIRFFNFWITVFSSVATLIIMQSFIKVWFGEVFLLSNFVLIILIIDMYPKSMRISNDVFLNAAGICVETRYVPLIESVLNIVFSLILLKVFGLSGIFMGTIISSLALWCYTYPKFVYKKLLGGTYKNYIKENLKFLALFTIIAAGTYLLSTIVKFDNLYIQFALNIFISIAIPNLVLYLIYRKTDDFKYFVELLKVILNKKNREI